MVAYQQGDLSAFEELYRQLQPALRHYLISLTLELQSLWYTYATCDGFLSLEPQTDDTTTSMKRPLQAFRLPSSRRRVNKVTSGRTLKRA